MEESMRPTDWRSFYYGCAAGALTLALWFTSVLPQSLSFLFKLTWIKIQILFWTVAEFIVG
jgi:hypothetical protein